MKKAKTELEKTLTPVNLLDDVDDREGLGALVPDALREPDEEAPSAKPRTLMDEISANLKEVGAGIKVLDEDIVRVKALADEEVKAAGKQETVDIKTWAKQKLEDDLTPDQYKK